MQVGEVEARTDEVLLSYVGHVSVVTCCARLVRFSQQPAKVLSLSLLGNVFLSPCVYVPQVLTATSADVYSTQLGQELASHLPLRIADTDSIVCLVLQSLFHNPCLADWVRDTHHVMVKWLPVTDTVNAWCSQFST